MSDNIIDKNKPEIDVDAIMAKIRTEVTRRRQNNRELVAQCGTSTVASSNIISRPSFINTSAILSNISSAEAHSAVGTEVTPMLQFPSIVRKMALLAGKVILFLSSFITFKQREFNFAIIRALRTTADGLERANSEILSGIQNEIKSAAEVMRAEVKGQIDSMRAEVNSEILSGIQNEIKSAAEVMRAEVTSRIEGMGTEANSRTESMRAEQVKLMETATNEQNALTRRTQEQKIEIINLQRSLSLFLEEAKKRLPEPLSKEQIETLLKEEDHLLDAMYVSFEDQFRGTREDIKERQKVYLPYIERAKAGTEDTPILDVGCGRGEWLEILKENGYIARGIDFNRVMIQQCKELGLNVAEDDAIEYLRSQKPNSCSAITGFHIIEHLPLKKIIALFDESLRVLRPGGVTIFETPNPQNILVGSCNFYMDPTHKNPLPSPLMKFMAEERGLCMVEILNLHPYPETSRLAGSELAEQLNEYFYGARDYAVIGWKE